MARRRIRPFRPVVGSLEARLNLSTTSSVPSIIYVNAAAATTTTTGTSTTVPDGSTWSKAFTSLQDALTLAATAGKPEQIWIAQGTYTPSEVYSPTDSSGTAVAGGASGLTTSNLMTFDVPNNVSLIGGFVAGQTSASNRSPLLHPTILSGDIDGNDLADSTAAGYAASKADNADHVVTIGDDVTGTGTRATLSGLEITDGYAAGTNVGGTTAALTQGGADGGAVFAVAGSHVSIDHANFVTNTAATDGGAVFASGSDLAVTTSTFTGNTAGNDGGAIAVNDEFATSAAHHAVLARDTFRTNTATNLGGAVVAQGGSQAAGSSLVIDGSTFSGNQAAEGGAVLVDTLLTGINETRFLSNTATVGGGALATGNITGTTLGATDDTTTTDVINSSFVGNIAQGSSTAAATLTTATGTSFGLGGGAIATAVNGRLNAGSDFFRTNSATSGDGGAILDGDSSLTAGTTSAYAATTRIFGSTFLSNTASAGHGGALAAETDGLTTSQTDTGTAITVAGSGFSGNTSSDTGLNLYLDDASAIVFGNFTTDTTTTRGKGLVAVGSLVNGVATTTSTTTSSGTTTSTGTTTTSGTTTS